MALLGRGRTMDVRGRSSHRESEWSSFCDDVLNEYIDHDDPFGFGTENRKYSSSNASANLFDFSRGSEHGAETGGTSPMIAWEHQRQVLETRQPAAKGSDAFWAKALWTLEQNAAAESEHKQRALRTAKSHPDFLSLGGYPSPPAIPFSPTSQSLSVHRQRPRQPGTAANGRNRGASQARSLSRGRPTGVLKSTAGASSKTSATVRKSSASPVKMMTPSRFRAGFKDIWKERGLTSPRKHEHQTPPMPDFLASPPLSGRVLHEDEFDAVFGSQDGVEAMTANAHAFAHNSHATAGYDEELSPLTTTFRRAHIHTPLASPALHGASKTGSAYFEEIPPLPLDPYSTQTVAFHDTAQLVLPPRTSSLAPHKILSFDFGFDDGDADLDPFCSPPCCDAITAPPDMDLTFSSRDPFGDIDSTIIPTTEFHEPLPPMYDRLGVSCDPSRLVKGELPLTIHDRRSMPYQRAAPSATPYYVLPAPRPGQISQFPRQTLNGLPITPYRASIWTHRSTTPPSPTMPSSVRLHQETYRSTSRHHRRTKSSGHAPRPTTSPEKFSVGGGSFVNYTPHDYSKILRGVAPSGSSKTKARREKEAELKRRRLSQAAVRAVVEAGGDAEQLRGEGFLE